MECNLYEQKTRYEEKLLPYTAQHEHASIFLIRTLTLAALFIGNKIISLLNNALFVHRYSHEQKSTMQARVVMRWRVTTLSFYPKYIPLPNGAMQHAVCHTVGDSWRGGPRS